MKIQEIIMGLVVLATIGVSIYFWGDPMAIVALGTLVVELLFIGYRKFIKK
jgi:hypothetical protein